MPDAALHQHSAFASSMSTGASANQRRARGLKEGAHKDRAQEEKVRLRGVQGSRNNKILELARSLARLNEHDFSLHEPNWKTTTVVARLKLKCPFFQMFTRFRMSEFRQDQYLESSLSLANLTCKAKKCQLSNTQLLSLARAQSM